MSDNVEMSNLTVVGGGEGFEVRQSVIECSDGTSVLHISLTSGQYMVPSPLHIRWDIPLVDIHAYWHPGSDRNRGLGFDFGFGFVSKATSQAPVACLFSRSGRNRFTFALSETLQPVNIKCGVHEESAEMRCELTLFTESATACDSYDLEIRLDTRDIPYYEALSDVARWWEKLPGHEPSPVPELARLPMYSTWYSFHQQLTANEIETQCKLAREIGCEVVIVDDGWQTTNTERGYAYTGDWEPVPERIPDIQAHIDRVHRLGMAYMLWYSVPFVGVHSEAWKRFEGKLLHKIERLDAGVLDPRFPEVREYLIGKYESAVRDWGLDGLKLDFVDSFGPPRRMAGTLSEPAPADLQILDGRDYASVPEAVDRLLTDVTRRLRDIKPSVMIEFRQSYIGPLMRKYGNMFRAGDCPNDSITNRVRTLDIRLICGNTATHSDMLMWHPLDPVESAALQIISILFSVPQISVKLDEIPEDHREMVRFWLRFWRENRDVLLDGELRPLHPELLYPVVITSNRNRRVVAVYADVVVEPGREIPDELILVNGTASDQITLRLGEDIGTRDLVVSDCRGREGRRERLELHSGLAEVELPPSGVAWLHQV